MSLGFVCVCARIPTDSAAGSCQLCGLVETQQIRTSVRAPPHATPHANATAAAAAARAGSSTDARSTTDVSVDGGPHASDLRRWKSLLLLAGPSTASCAPGADAPASSASASAPGALPAVPAAVPPAAPAVSSPAGVGRADHPPSFPSPLALVLPHQRSSAAVAAAGTASVRRDAAPRSSVRCSSSRLLAPAARRGRRGSRVPAPHEPTARLLARSAAADVRPAAHALPATGDAPAEPEPRAGPSSNADVRPAFERWTQFRCSGPRPGYATVRGATASCAPAAAAGPRPSASPPSERLRSPADGLSPATSPAAVPAAEDAPSVRPPGRHGRPHVPPQCGLDGERRSSSAPSSPAAASRYVPSPHLPVADRPRSLSTLTVSSLSPHAIPSTYL